MGIACNNSSPHCCNSVACSNDSQTEVKWVMYKHRAQYPEIRKWKDFKVLNRKKNLSTNQYAKICKVIHRYQIWKNFHE